METTAQRLPVKWAFPLAVVGISLLAVVIQAAVYSRHFYSTSADECGRTFMVVEHMRHPAGMAVPGTWLPLYSVIHGVPLLIFRDLFLTPRIVSAVFGLGVVWALMWLSWLLFRRRSITLLTGAFAVALPDRVILSAVPLGEIIHIFLITSALGFFIRWLRSSQRAHLFTACLFIGLSTATRYEGWFFSASVLSALVYYVIKGRLPARDAAIAGAMMLVFPAYWLAAAHLLGSTAGMSVASQRYDLSFGSDAIGVLKKNIPGQFLKQMLSGPLVFGLAALLWLCRTDKVVRIFAIVLLVQMVLASIVLQWQHSLPSHNHWRLVSLYLALLLPFLAYGIFAVSERLTRHGRRRAAIAGLCSLIVISAFLYQVAGRVKIGGFTGDDLRAGRWIMSHGVEYTGAVLIESSDWNYLNVEIAANGERDFVRFTGSDPHRPDKPVCNLSGPDCLSALRQRDIGLLLFHNPVQVRRLRSLDGIREKEIFGGWHIFECRPRRAPRP